MPAPASWRAPAAWPLPADGDGDGLGDVEAFAEALGLDEGDALGDG